MSESIFNIIDTHYETLVIWQSDAAKITQSPILTNEHPEVRVMYYRTRLVRALILI